VAGEELQGYGLVGGSARVAVVLEDVRRSRVGPDEPYTVGVIGSWQTLYTRFRRWALDGTFSRMLKAIQAEKDAAGDIDWLVSVDSTIVRAHQHAAGGKKGRSTGTKQAIKPSADLAVD
jgi:hypothetical protein